MGSREYIGTKGLRIVVTFVKAGLCAACAVLLVTGSQTTHAQPPVPPTLDRIALPQNHQLPLAGGLTGGLTGNFEDDFEAKSGQFRAQAVRSAKRRVIPTLRARYRPQDGDLFGEGQADSDDSAGGSIFDQLEDGPQPPATKRPTQSNPFGEPNQKNPFDAPKKRTTFDPSPREPLMDTKREEPTLDRRREGQTPRQSGRDGMPRLPEDGEFTPDRGSIPEMPTPDGGTRSTEKAGTDPRDRNEDPIIRVPEEEEDLSGAVEDFNDDLEGYDLVDPRDRTPRSGGSSRRRRSTIDRDWRPKSRASNVYRPAREPSYYTRPTDTYGQYPPGYDANNPYASQPYAAPNAMEAIVHNAVQYAMRNYAANPANPAVAPYYGRSYACPPCPPSLLSPPSPQLAAANCGCGPGTQGFPTDPALMLSQQFTQPSSSSCPPTVANDVYEGVVCGDQEIESYDPQCFPRKKSGLHIGGLGIGAIRNNGPGIYYGSIFGGWTGLDDLMLSGDEGQIQIGNDDGFAGGLAFGQIQGKNLRSELEVTYRSNDLNGMTLNDLAGGTQFLEGAGTIESISGMVNVIWDFTDFPTLCFKPYLGAGFGGISADANFEIDGERTLGDGNDTSLAYQWIAGINYQTRGLSDLYVEYRYFAADSLHFNTTLPAGSIIDGDGELEYRTSSVLFGLRMKF